MPAPPGCVPGQDLVAASLPVSPAWPLSPWSPSGQSAGAAAGVQPAPLPEGLSCRGLLGHLSTPYPFFLWPAQLAGPRMEPGENSGVLPQGEPMLSLV